MNPENRNSERQRRNFENACSWITTLGSDFEIVCGVLSYQSEKIRKFVQLGDLAFVDSFFGGARSGAVPGGRVSGKHLQHRARHHEGKDKIGISDNEPDVEREQPDMAALTRQPPSLLGYLPVSGIYPALS